RSSVVTAGILAGVLLLSGCTLPSEVTEFPTAAVSTERETSDLRHRLETAIHTTDQDEKAQSYWYTGYVKNNIGRRSTTSMYDGIVYRPNEAFLVNGRV